MSIADIEKAQASFREANKTRPPCPVHMAQALQHFENAKNWINNRVDQINLLMESQRGE